MPIAPTIDPKISTDALAIASYALITTLIDDIRTRNSGRANAIIQAAMMGVSARVKSGESAEALKVLQSLLNGLPKN